MSGHHIPSTAGHLSLYPSSKYAMTAMTEVVRRELISAKTNIKVTVSGGLYVFDTVLHDSKLL